MFNYFKLINYLFFFRKFGLEVLKSINKPDPSLQIVCRNVCVLAVAINYNSKVMNFFFNLLK